MTAISGGMGKHIQQIVICNGNNAENKQAFTLFKLLVIVSSKFMTGAIYSMRYITITGRAFIMVFHTFSNETYCMNYIMNNMCYIKTEP